MHDLAVVVVLLVEGVDAPRVCEEAYDGSFIAFYLFLIGILEVAFVSMVFLWLVSGTYECIC